MRRNTIASLLIFGLAVQQSYGGCKHGAKRTPRTQDPAYFCDVDEVNNQLLCYVNDDRPANFEVPATLSLLVASPRSDKNLLYVCGEDGERLACLPDPDNREPTSLLNGLVTVLPSPTGDRKYNCANNGSQLVCLLVTDQSTLIPADVVQIAVPGQNNEELVFNCVLNGDRDLYCDPENPSQQKPSTDVDYTVAVPTTDGDKDYLCTFAAHHLVCHLYLAKVTEAPLVKSEVYQGSVPDNKGGFQDLVCVDNGDTLNCSPQDGSQFTSDTDVVGSLKCTCSAIGHCKCTSLNLLNGDVDGEFEVVMPDNGFGDQSMVCVKKLRTSTTRRTTRGTTRVFTRRTSRRTTRRTVQLTTRRTARRTTRRTTRRCCPCPEDQ